MRGLDQNSYVNKNDTKVDYIIPIHKNSKNRLDGSLL